MLDATLTKEVHGWRWVAHSVVEGLLIVALLCAAGPLTLRIAAAGGTPVVPEDPVAEVSGG